jgi:hypothetical protein
MLHDIEPGLLATAQRLAVPGGSEVPVFSEEEWDQVVDPTLRPVAEIKTTLDPNDPGPSYPFAEPVSYLVVLLIKATQDPVPTIKARLQDSRVIESAEVAYLKSL